jgi:hypothetical protein
MTIDLIPEDELRAALRPFRVDPDSFAADVRERLTAAEKQRAEEPLARLSPFLRAAAAFLPLEVLAGCQGTAAAAKLAPVGGVYKVISYLAFPAISLFVLLGATIFSVWKIRSIQDQNVAGLSDQQAIQMAIHAWWRRHWWSGRAVVAATLILMFVGVPWVLFLFYLVSFGLLLFVLGSFAKLGLGNRQLIGESCGTGLLSLGQAAMVSEMCNSEIHFLDQKLVSAIFFAGVLILLPYSMSSWILSTNLTSEIARRLVSMRRSGLAFMFVLVVPLTAWMMNSILWPVTPSRMRHFVESFEEARYSTVSWQNWAIVARWVVDSKLDPDLSKPRRLLAKEIEGKPNPLILRSAVRVGLLPADQIGQLKDYERQRRDLFAAPPRGLAPQVITSLDQQDWVIRAAVLRNELSPDECDRLEQRLYATLENMSIDRDNVLKSALHVTQLLDVIERPIDRDEYRETVHDWLRKLHATNVGWLQLNGGFKQSLKIPYGYLESTAHAVELMEIYGVPDDLDLNSIRSYLRPSTLQQVSDQKWIAAATLDRLNHLPGAKRPTWLEVLYYERTLLAAIVLVGLCFYATFSSPPLKVKVAAASQPAPE